MEALLLIQTVGGYYDMPFAKNHKTHNFKDLTGQQINDWEVLEKSVSKDGYHAYWKCRCKCGQIRDVNATSLRNGESSSCGCAYESIKKKYVNGDKLYHTWSRIKSRCYNENDKNFNSYGGRGIKLYSEWINDSTAFIEYIVSLEGYPDTELSIDRINNDGDYEPGNLRWATMETQAQNRRSTKFTENDIKEIRKLSETMTQESIANIFNTTQARISEIVIRKTWKNVC